MKRTNAQQVSIQALFPAKAASSAVACAVSTCFCKPEASSPPPPSTSAHSGATETSIEKTMPTKKHTMSLRTSMVTAPKKVPARKSGRVRHLRTFPSIKLVSSLSHLQRESRPPKTRHYYQKTLLLDPKTGRSMCHKVPPCNSAVKDL